MKSISLLGSLDTLLVKVWNLVVQFCLGDVVIRYTEWYIPHSYSWFIGMDETPVMVQINMGQYSMQWGHNFQYRAGKSKFQIFY